MNELWWLVPLIIITDIALVASGFVYARRRKGPGAPVITQERLRGELDTLRSAMEGLDGCLATVDRALQQRRSEPEPEPAPEPEPDGDGRLKGYAIARRLARKGATAEELMNDCGLTRGEAELIHNLHGART